MRMILRRLGAVLAVTGLALSACGGSDDEPSSTIDSYVALGDSFVAGLGLNPQVKDSGDCGRSQVNWPSLVAKDLDVKDFTDKSCSGAVTGDLLDSRKTADGTVVPAQIDAVTKDTQLVTLSIGGNNGALYRDLFLSCGSLSGAANDACEPFVSTKMPGLLEAITTAVEQTLTAVRAKAPDAEIVMVGYLGVAPESGTCDGLLSPANVTVVAGAEDRLDSTLAEAAQAQGVRYVSLRSASGGHDVCAGSSAWVNGLAPDAGDGAILHPNAAGMKGAAKAVSAFISGV